MNRELRIATWHGENKTVHYILSVNPDSDEDWEVLASFPNLYLAKRFVEMYETGESETTNEE
jgi:hypothetical protein